MRSVALRCVPCGGEVAHWLPLNGGSSFKRFCRYIEHRRQTEFTEPQGSKKWLTYVIGKWWYPTKRFQNGAERPKGSLRAVFLP